MLRVKLFVEDLSKTGNLEMVPYTIWGEDDLYAKVCTILSMYICSLRTFELYVEQNIKFTKRCVAMLLRLV